MSDIFVSYARSTAAQAQQIAEALRALGYGVWRDDELPAHRAYAEVIEERLKAAKAVVVIWSAEAVKSQWVRAEADVARELGTLVQLTIDGATPPLPFNQIQCAEMSSWSGDPGAPGWRKVVSSIADLVGGAAGGGGVRTAQRPAEPEDLGRSICVLPFVNMSGDPEQEYFSDGLSEELLNQLAQMKGLKVAARTSCFAFKGQTPDLKLVGDKLGVAHVLEGSVRKAGNRLRITAQLIKAADGYHLWSNTFNRELDDVFQIQEDIARAVADALKVTLGMGETLTPGGTTNIEAYDLYLRAQALARHFTPAELIRGEQLFRQALALDPEFGLGWVRLANVLFFLGLYVPERSAEFYKAMDEAVARALSLAPDLWESHWARGMRALRRYDWRETEAAFAKALALAPDNEPEPAYWMSVVHIHAGRAGAATPYVEAARRIDPLSTNISYQLQQDLTIAGRWDEAETEYARSEDLTGDKEPSEHTGMWRACARGDDKAFKARMQRFLDAESISLPVLREVSVLMDRPEAAHAKLREAFEDPANRDATRQFKLAMWAAHFGDVDLSLSGVRRAFVEGKALPLNTIWLPMMAPVRKDPRFKDILRDLGLVDYWRETGDWGDFARPVGNDDFEIIA